MHTAARCLRALACCETCCCALRHHLPADEALERRSVIVYKSHALVSHTAAFSGVATEHVLQHLTG